MQNLKNKQANAPRFFAHKTDLSKALFPVILLVAVLIVGAFTMGFVRISGDGLQLRNIQGMYDVLLLIGRHATPVIIMAMAMTLVIATKGIDLSVGAVAAIAGVSAAILMMGPNPPSLPMVIAICLGIGALAGIWNGILVTYLRLQPFIATLILMVAGRGIAQVLPSVIGETEGTILTLPLNAANADPIFKAFCDLGNGAFLGLPNRFFLVAFVFLLTWFIARKTVCGTFIEAVGSNETAAKYCGINASLVKIFVYGFSGLCAALAGLLLTAQVASADANTMALRDHNELDVILAVIIGGTAFSGGKFSLFGSLIGALIMRTLIFQVQAAGLNWGYALALRGLAVVIVCLIQSPVFRESVSSVFKRRRLA